MVHVLRATPTGWSDAYAVQHVAVRGERIAVAAIGHTVTVGQLGAVLAFERQFGSWQQRKRLVAPNPVIQSYFGSVMAVGADDSLVVSAREESSMFEFQSAVYAFTPPASNLLADGFG